MSEARDERRRKERAAEQARRQEIDKVMDEPRLPSFEAPPTGKLVENPPQPKKIPAPAKK